MIRQVAWLRTLVLGILVLASACQPGGSETCLSGAKGCEQAALCEGLEFQCESSGLFIGRLADLPGGLDLSEAEGSGIDFVLQNGEVTIVIDALEEPHGLAPTGGNIIDMGSRGGADDLNLIYQLSGILPEDTFSYKTAEFIDQSPAMVALVVRGILDGRPEIEVVTRYELQACDPGVRVRTELYNGSQRIRALSITDTGHWGERNLLPFTPLPSQGFVQPEFELLTLQDSFADYEFVLARAAEDSSPSYGFVSCDRDKLSGVNSSGISAVGTKVGLVRPGGERSYERFIASVQSRDLNEASEIVASVRRQLHGDRESVVVRGNVIAEGLAVPGTLRRAVVVISEIVGDSKRRPLTTVIPDEQGQFEALVPSQSWLWYDLWSFGRIVKSGTIQRGSSTDIGTLEIESPATLNVSMTKDGIPVHGTLVVHPTDEVESDRLRGTWLGEFTPCSPWLGPPVGASPACNVVNLVPQGSDFELPAGCYQLWFNGGPESSLGRIDLEVVAGEVRSVELDLHALDLAPDNWLSTDLHVHGAASFDTSMPDKDRVQSFVAHGIDVIASTDHDYITDYAATVRDLGVESKVRVIAGLETTPLIPYLDVPGSDVPKVIGHFNHWPLTIDPAAPRGGAPWDERIEPGELFELLDPQMGEEPIHMLNHPWDNLQFGRDLGFLRAIGFDPRKEIPTQEDGSNNGVLMTQASGGTRNIDFQLLELQNGVGVVQVIKTRPLWFSLLSAGHVRSAVANSDSHALDVAVGYGRSYVDAGVGIDDFDVVLFNRALKRGKVIGGNGVFVIVTIGPEQGTRRGMGLAPYQPQTGDTLQIEVRAAPWIPIDEVRITTSMGERVIASVDEITHPSDPLGRDGLVRYKTSIAVDSLVPPGNDDWIVVEAGMAFYANADLDEDGVPDTGDNNEDGLVDEADIEDDDEDSGPLRGPPDPINPSDPRYAMTRVLPTAWSYGFANPLLLDWDGDGWTPPKAVR